MIRPAAHKINQDHWGFYEIGPLRSYSKLEAIEISAKNKHPIRWNYNNQVFEQYDWTQEPPGTLEYWYRLRAQQLRDRYDYLVLLYSGGADSHNMLMTFVSNNIFVDEIVQMHSLEAYNGDRQAEPNAEIFETSIPVTQALIANHPLYKHTLHRVIDISKWQSTMFNIKANKWDYFYNSSTWQSPWSQCLGSIRSMEPAYEKLAEQGRNLCFVGGFDKPAIDIDQHNNFYFIIEDGGVHGYVQPRQQAENISWHHTEQFYATPDLPELSIKQAHTLKRFMLGLNPQSVDGRYVKGGKFDRKKLDNQFHAWPAAQIMLDDHWYQLSKDGLHKLVYPHWISDSVVCPKPMSAYFGQKDLWLWDKMAPDLGQRRYQKSVVWLRDYVKKLDSSMWWEFPFDPGSGMPYQGGMKILKNRYCLDRSA